MASKQRGFSIKAENLDVQVSGSDEKVRQVYDALQGVINTTASSALTSGDGLTLDLEAHKDEERPEA